MLKTEKLDRTQVESSNVSIVSKREFASVKKGGELFLSPKKAAQMFVFTENPDNADACRKILHEFASMVLFNERVDIPEDFAESFLKDEDSIKTKLNNGDKVNVTNLPLTK